MTYKLPIQGKGGTNGQNGEWIKDNLLGSFTVDGSSVGSLQGTLVVAGLEHLH